MFDIRRGVIYHTRGDTADFDIDLKVNEQPVSDYDAVLSVKRSYKDKDCQFQIEAEDGHIHISHETTQNMPFGDYCYDIEIHVADDTEEGRYITIGPYPYHLLADVTVEKVEVS